MTHHPSLSPSHRVDDQGGSFYYGWVMLPLAALMQIATSPGQTFGVSIFNAPIRETLQLSHSQLTGCYLLASLLAAAPMPLVGWLADRVGLRKTGLAVIVLLGLACAATSRAHGMVTLTIGFLMLRTFGQGALTLLSVNTLAMWFSRRLGLVSGVMGLGTSIGIAVLPQVYLSLIDSVGWRNAYLVLGGATVGVMLPLLFFLFQNRPEDVGQRLDGRAAQGGEDSAAATSIDRSAASGDREREFDLQAAWRTRAYWIGLGIHTMWGMIGTAIVFNVVPLFEWQGLSETQAATTFTTFAVCMAVMQLIGGVLADRIPLNLLFAMSVSGLLAGVLVLWNMDTIWEGHLYATLFGSAARTTGFHRQYLLGTLFRPTEPRQDSQFGLDSYRGRLQPGPVHARVFDRLPRRLRASPGVVLDAARRWCDCCPIRYTPTKTPGVISRHAACVTDWK